MHPFRSNPAVRRQYTRILWMAFVLLVCVGLILTASPANPVEVIASGQQTGDSGYVIENFQVNIELTDANVYRVHQVIDVEFFERSRGIFVNIPLFSTVDLEGADFNQYKARITNIQVEGYDYEAYTENGQRIIRIGDPDVWLDGRHSYEIRYNYSAGKDYSDLADFLYFNLIGPQWTTSMLNVDFNIHMPHDFDAEGLNFTVGYFGSEDNQRVDYRVEGQTISGTVPGGLLAFEAVTVYLELPDGYFSSARHFGAWLNPVVIVISILSLLAVILLYLRVGRDRPVPETVEFYAPDGIDPAHAGYLADGMPDSKDLIALLMYWADQGFLHIIDQDKKLSLKKLADLPQDRPVYQKTIFNGLFSGRDFVTMDELKNTFYKTLETGKGQLQGSHQDKTFESKSRTARAGGLLLCLLPLILSLLRTFQVGLFRESVVYLVGSAICAAIFIFGLVMLILNRAKWRIRSRFGRIVAVLFFAPLMFLAQFGLAALTASSTYDPWATAYVAGICSLLCAPFLVFMSRRTLEGEQLFARLMGFRNFMMTAEKSRIEALVHDNPAYFYNVLPYAYVLGVTDKWAKRFDGLAIQPPTWYYGNTMTTFTALYFANQMNRAASTMNTVMVSQPSSSGGGGGFGGGGGGFSGGGFGGGGGGRW